MPLGSCQVLAITLGSAEAEEGSTGLFSGSLASSDIFLVQYWRWQLANTGRYVSIVSNN
jgi:hypothetical protein